MTRLDPNEAVGEQVRVVARTSQGDVYGAGRVIAYSIVPTFTIERPDGTRFSWRHDMVEPLIHGQVDYEENLARNRRTYQHEIETPMRGHDADGRCCLLAAMGMSET